MGYVKWWVNQWYAHKAASAFRSQSEVIKISNLKSVVAQAIFRAVNYEMKAIEEELLESILNISKLFFILSDMPIGDLEE